MGINQRVFSLNQSKHAGIFRRLDILSTGDMQPE